METDYQNGSKTSEYAMRKIYLEGQLGEKFGEEWSLDVSSPAEALQAIMAQRPGMRQFITSSEGIQGYEVLVDNESIDMLEELVIQDPSMKQSYTFVPVIGGSKNAGIMMVLGVALIAATGGMAAFGVMGLGAAGGTGAVAGAGLVGTTAAAGTAAVTASGAAAVTAAGTYTIAGAAAAASTSTAAILATQGLGYLGTALLLGGASMMLAPDVPDGTSAEKAENYLFSGPVNTIKQGSAIPLVYGRAIVGSSTISASVFTNTSRQKLTAGRKMVGIPNFRTDGSQSGLTATTTSYSNQFDLNIRF
jgi:predicted phage tail protein